MQLIEYIIMPVSHPAISTFIVCVCYFVDFFLKFLYLSVACFKDTFTLIFFISVTILPHRTAWVLFSLKSSSMPAGSCTRRISCSGVHICILQLDSDSAEEDIPFPINKNTVQYKIYDISYITILLLNCKVVN